MPNVSHREGFDGARQRAALTHLQDQSKRPATQLAAEIGLSYNQYLRYVWGKTPLRFDQVEAFARAYGVAPRSLVDLVLRDEIPERGRVLRERLTGRIPQDALEQLIREHGDAPDDEQAILSDQALEMTAEQIEATRAPRRRRHSA